MRYQSKQEAYTSIIVKRTVLVRLTKPSVGKCSPKERFPLESSFYFSFVVFPLAFLSVNYQVRCYLYIFLNQH